MEPLEPLAADAGTELGSLPSAHSCRRLRRNWPLKTRKVSTGRIRDEGLVLQSLTWLPPRARLKKGPPDPSLTLSLFGLRFHLIWHYPDRCGPFVCVGKGRKLVRA